MPSPLVPVQYRSPAHETAYARPLISFTGTCPACAQDCPWTTTTDGPLPHCPCEQETAA